MLSVGVQLVHGRSSVLFISDGLSTHLHSAQPVSLHADDSFQ